MDFSMQTLRCVPVSAFSDNYIWVLDDGKNAAVVDPGDAAPVLGYLQRTQLTLTAILLTHHHDDHVGGVTALQAANSGRTIPVYGPIGSGIATVTHAAAEGDTVELAEPAASLRVLAVPGHTLDHIAYYLVSGNVPRVFCGDTLFAGGCGRLFEGTPEQMLTSLDKLAALPPQTWVHCAHEYTLSNLRFAQAVEPGNVALQQWVVQAKALRQQNVPTVPTTLAHEHQTNPFLRCESPEVIASVTRQAGDLASTRQAYFTALREWKNVF